MAVALFATLHSCNKDESQVESVPDTITSSDYQFNTANKKFTPGDSVKVQIASPTGVRLVYNYLVRTDKPDSLINVYYAPAGDNNDVSYAIPLSIFSKINMINAKGIRVMVKHDDNTSYDGMVKITSFTPPLPGLSGFPSTILPDKNNIVKVTGTAASQNGIRKIYIYDDVTGAYTKADSIIVTNDVTQYNVNYNYTYRPNARNIKIVVVDKYDLTAEKIIKMPIMPYNVFQDVLMGAQGTTTITVTNNTFFTETGTTAGSCELNANEASMDFLFYGTSSGPTFYSPSNTGNVAANFKCDGNGWVIANSSVLKATKFRVLVPGTPEIDAVYTKFNSNAIDSVTETSLFADVPVPSGSTARYTAPPAAPSTSIFNTATAYLIWVRIPRADGTFKNALIRAKDVVVASTTGLSTITFDIYVQK